MVRIISGIHKRRQLEVPKGFDITRPTSDRVKESLFNIIASQVPQARVLDLFAGTGSLGLECLSRGASCVTFVESHKVALRALETNVKTLGVQAGSQALIVSESVEQFLGRVPPPSQVASNSLVFADPPYASNWYDQALVQLNASNLCADGCLFCVEMSEERGGLNPSLKEQVQPQVCFLHPNGARLWLLEDVRIYGKARYEFWRLSIDDKHA